ncbi:MAG TPA: choice-of-anchor V domain-containing protein [Polyangiaceae bacterium]
MKAVHFLFARSLASAAMLAVAASVFFVAGNAQAFPTGVNSSQFPSLTTGCNGCHSGGTAPSVTLTADSNCLSTGATTILHGTVTATNGNEAGWNLRVSIGAGALSVGGADSSLTQLRNAEITHTAPKTAAADNLIHFSATYTAPANATTTTFTMWGNSVNGNGSSSGDRAATTSLMLTVAAPPTCGAESCGTITNACGVLVVCDNTCTAPTICTGNTCVCPAGAPNAVCGTGQCRRVGTSCLASSCTPGPTTDEICNGLDDDCDGVPDNGALCAAGQICIMGGCVNVVSVVDAGDDAPADASDEEASVVVDVGVDAADDVAADDASDVISVPDVTMTDDASAPPPPIPDAAPTEDASMVSDVSIAEASSAFDVSVTLDALVTIDASSSDDVASPMDASLVDATTAETAPSTDAASAVDASIPEDAGGFTVADANRGADAESREGASGADVAVRADAASDAGESGIPADNGCACRMTESRSAPTGAWLVAFAAVVGFTRRRRARLSPAARHS